MSKEIPAAPAQSAVPAAPEAPPAAPAATLAGAFDAPPAIVELSAPPAAPKTPPSNPPATPPAASETPETPWFYAEGVPGKDKAPEWFKADKYKTVEEQAKAYTALEKRFGAFTGAPEGDYAINLPEQIKGQVEFDTTDPLFVKLGEFARQSQMSQKAYDSIIGLLADYELQIANANAPPTLEQVKTEIGANADARIASVANWTKGSLDATAQALVREALAKPTEATVFKALEAVVAKTRQLAMPKPGEDVKPPPANELDEINKLQAAVDKNGRRPYVEDSKYREDVERRRREYFAKLKAAS